MLNEFDLSKETINPFEAIGKKWFLVSSGDKNGFNTMTASWGFMGVMWNKNVVETVIRPQRYTKEFIDKNDLFTISFFPESCRDALKFCGAHSGRDCDKAAQAGITPVFLDGTVSFKEAEMVLVCRKLYTQPMTAESFTDKTLIDSCYGAKDFHIAYIGEIIKAYKA